jgi:hypothetical protein
VSRRQILCAVCGDTQNVSPAAKKKGKRWYPVVRKNIRRLSAHFLRLQLNPFCEPDTIDRFRFGLGRKRGKCEFAALAQALSQSKESGHSQA